MVAGSELTKDDQQLTTRYSVRTRYWVLGTGTRYWYLVLATINHYIGGNEMKRRLIKVASFALLAVCWSE